MISMRKLFVWDRETRFLILFTLVLLISFSPSKALGQFVAVFCLAGFLFFVRIRQRQNLIKLVALILAYSILGVFYYLALPEFSFINYFLFLLTISSALIWFIDFSPILNDRFIRKLSSIILPVLSFEALYGIAQGLVSYLRSGSFDFSSGDNVRGTIEPSFTAQGLGGNVMFVILLSSLFIFALGISRLRFTRIRIFIYGLVIFAWLIASVLHTILFFGVAVLVAILLIKMPRRDRQRSRRLSRFRTAVLVLTVCLAILLPILLPKNLATLPNFISYTTDIREDAYSEKARAIFYTIFRLPQDFELQPIIGIGPGQYSSRASLIRTGEYLKGSGIPLPNYTSSATGKYIMPLWASFLKRPGGGSTYFPFSSWMSLYGEMGVFGMIAVLYAIFRVSFKLRKWNSKEYPGLNLALLVLLFYIAFLGLQDNYWEFTQAIFPAFLTLTIGYQYLQKTYREERELDLAQNAISNQSAQAHVG